MTPPIQPVTLDVAELTAIKTSLTERAHRLRTEARRRDGRLVQPDARVLRAQAGRLDDIAARLSFARPGEPIQVADA
ncbi:MAG TPA: hypothetical protein VK586_16215 [Streptosporangiaceae bacterium]|nr:hypothetical protein [Streptosporangiaceae bacterium]